MNDFSVIFFFIRDRCDSSHATDPFCQVCELCDSFDVIHLSLSFQREFSDFEIQKAFLCPTFVFSHLRAVARY